MNLESWKPFCMEICAAEMFDPSRLGGGRVMEIFIQSVFLNMQ